MLCKHHSVFSLLLTCSELVYTEIPLAAAYVHLKLVASSSLGTDTVTVALPALQVFLHLF